MEQHTKKNFIITFTYLLILGLIIYFSITFLLNYLLPFIIGGIIAYASQKPSEIISSKLSVKKINVSPFIALLICLAVCLIFLAIGYFLFVGCRNIFNDIDGFSKSLSVTLDKLKGNINNMLSLLSDEISSILSSVLNDAINDLSQKIGTFFTDFATNIASKIPSFLFSVIVTVVAACYIAKDYKILSRFVRELLGDRKFGNIVKIKIILKESVFKLLKGYLILLVLTFAELCVGFILIRVKYPIFLAFIVSFVDLLPVFGTGTVLIPWGVIEIALGNGNTGVLLIVIYIAITVIRNFAEPKIIGSQIGINPLFTLIAMFLGLKVASVAGLILFPIILIVIIKYYKGELKEERESGFDLADYNQKHNM